MSLLLNNNVINKVFYNNNVGYTIVGTPTISDGIVSNFSNGNYIKLQSNIPIITSFEENIRFKITQDCAGKSLLSYSTTYNSNNLEGNINISNNLDSINTSLFIKYDGTYDTYIISYDFSQHLNEYFTFKVFTDLSNVYLYLYDKDNNLVGTNIYNNLNLVGIIDNNKILIGNIYDESDYWPSEINLNNTYIKFNNITWFNGKQTASTNVNYIIQNGGEVGYEIVGSPTINNGIATNYNASNYIPISIENVENINNFEFVTYVQLGELNSWVYGISADSIGISNARWMLGTSLNKIRLIAGDVGAWTVDFTSNSEFNVNDWIYIKVYCDYTTKTFTLYTSLDGITWINEGSAINENYIEGTSRIISLGRDNYALNCFAAIDINKTYIKYNNKIFFNGSSKLIWANPNIYLQSSGTQYIDTEIYGGTNTTFEIVRTINTINNAAVFGARNSTGLQTYTLFVADNGRFDYGTNSNWILGTTTIRKIVSYIENGKFYIQSYDYYNVLSQSFNKDLVTFTTPVTIKLYCKDNDGTLDSVLFIGKIYYFKIYNAGSLVRYFVPVPANFVVGRGYKTPSAGMFDIVEQKFYPNLGTGSFTYGKD